MPAWAFALCKFRDHPEEPISADFCQRYFIQAGTGGLNDYWKDISFGKVNLAGSKVLGPFALSYTVAEAWAAHKAYVEEKKKLGVDTNGREKLVQMAADEVAAKTDLTPFSGLVLIYNATLDTGATGTQIKLPGGSTRVVPAMNLDPGGFVPPRLGHLTEHESGHMLGLPHAHLLDPFDDYGDGWDVMGGQRLDGSGLDCRFDSPSVELNHPRSGPGLNSASLQRLGWIGPSRVTRYVNDGTAITVTLAPLNHPEAFGDFVAHVEPVDPPYSSLTVELRWNDGWDRGIPRPAFLLHMIGESGDSYLIPASASQHDWLPGLTYRIPGSLITIEFLDIDHTKRAGIVRITGAFPYFEELRSRFPIFRRPGPIPELLFRAAWRVFRAAWKAERVVREIVRMLRRQAPSPQLEPQAALCNLPDLLRANRATTPPADSPTERRPT